MRKPKSHQTTPSELRAQKASLERQLERVNGQLALFEQRDMSSVRGRGQHTATPGRSIRDLLVDALSDLGFLTYSVQLAHYISMRFGRAVPATRFGSLSAEERKAYGAPNRRSARPVWLVHGVTHDRCEPVRRLWGRSDWPLTERIVTPFTARVQYLRLTMHLIDLMANEVPVADPKMLRYTTVDQVRGIGVRVQNGDFSGYREWREVAAAHLREIEEKDRCVRHEAAPRLQDTRSERELLFGVTMGWEPLVVVNDESSSA